MPPVVLTIRAEDLASPVLRSLQSEVHKLGTTSTQAAPGLGALGTATSHLGIQSTAATGLSGGLRAALYQTGQAAAASTPAVTALGGATATAGRSFLDSVKGAVGFGVAVAGVQTGVQAVQQVLTAVVSHMASFESGLANVSTLIVGSASHGIGALREQLLALPPAFGSSTELAKGLYATLSAGIDAGNAVAFVGQAAQTAKAGLTTLETSVNTLTTIQHAYNLEARDTTRISDILFQTVNVGKGSFEQFSTAFASVSPMAKNLGISLEEVGATLGTLSFAFPTATQAGTALNSLMNNLIQHSGDFAAAGINVKQVIGEVGLTGLLKKLNEAMQGNDAAIQKLIPDQEGFRAALALTSTHVERQAGNLRDMGAAAGATSEAFKKQTATASAALDNLVGSLERATQQAAPPFLTAFTGIANTMAGVVTVGALAVSGAYNTLAPVIGTLVARFGLLRPELEGVNTAQFGAVKSTDTLATSQKTAAERARERVAAEQRLAVTTKLSATAAADLTSAQATLADMVAKGTATADERAQAEARVVVASNANANATMARGTAELDAAAKTKAAAASINELTVFVNQQIEAQDKLKNVGKIAAQELQSAFAGLGQSSSADLKRLADAAFVNFQKIQADGAEPPERLRVLWAAALGDIKKGYGTLPDTVKDVNAQIAALPLPVQPFMDKMRDAFAAFGDTTIFDFKKTADNLLLQFNNIKDGGLANTAQLQEYWEKTADAILKAYDELPAGFEEAGRQLEEASGETANAAAEAWKKSGIETKGALQIAATEGIASFKKILDDPDGATATSASLVKVFSEKITAITKGELPRLPAGFAEVAQQMKPHLQAMGLEIQTTTNTLGHLTVALVPLGTAVEKAGVQIGAFTHELDLSGISAEAAAANYRKLEPALDAVASAHAEATREAAGFGTILQRNIDLADLTLESTNKLNEGLAKASYQMDFADDAAGLRDQLARARQERGRVASQPDPLGTKGFREFTLKALDKEITILLGKLDALKAKETDTMDAAIAKTDTLTASTARLTTQTIAATGAVAQLAGASGAGGAAGDYPLMGGGRGSGGPYPDFAPGGRMPGAGSGAQPMPLSPSLSPGTTRPPGWNIPGRPLQRFAAGGIVQGAGGVDSQLILATPGERVSTPRQDRAISVSFGDITVHINGAGNHSPAAMSDMVAQALADKLLPRLRETARREGKPL